MATTKSMKIQAEIDKVKAKISEQQARLKELEQKKLEAENSEIVDIVRGMSIWAALDRIALPPQRFQKCIIGQAPSQRCVNVAADKVTDRTTAALFCVPCRIRHAFSIRFNHGVSEFPADFIGNAAQIVKVAFEIAAILSAIHERNGIENNVAMQVVAVGVRTDNGFVFVT